VDLGILLRIKSFYSIIVFSDLEEKSRNPKRLEYEKGSSSQETRWYEIYVTGHSTGQWENLYGWG